MRTWPGKFLLLVRSALRRILMILYRPLFQAIGRNVWFDPFGEYSFRTISIGNDVFLGPGTMILASETTVEIGDKVMFGPNVSVIGGDHNTSVVGEEMFDVKQKRSDDDQPIRIERDVWIGAGAIILKGVTIGTGSIVAAGSVVTKSIPAYSIAAGVPATVVRARWTPEQQAEHLERLGDSGS